MRINTNVASLNAQEATANTNKALSSSLEKLGTGLRINKAADDASGLAIADKLRTQASSLGQGISNANSASALIQIADKAMSEQSNILDTVKTKLIQASTSTTNADGREAIRKDVQKLLTQFDNIAAQTNYNGTTLLQKSATDTTKQDDLSFQLGEDSTFDVDMVQARATNTTDLGGGSTTITAGTNIEAQDALKIKDTAGTVTLELNVFNSAGDEVSSSNSATNLFDSSFTGNLGSIAQLGSLSSTVIDLSNQSQAVKDLAFAVAGSDNSAGYSQASYDEATNKLTIISNTALDFSKLDLSNAQITQTTDTVSEAAGITITDSEGFSIKNNVTDTAGAPDEFIDVTSTSVMTGGDILENLKDLGEGELTADRANDFMTTIDEALTQLNSTRSDFGSTQNQLESSIRNMQTTQTNLKAAESVVRDVDYAQESASFNKQNIIAQAGTYAMSQANSMAQNVQKLLQ